MTKYPKMTGKPTRTGLYKKQPIPKSKNLTRVSHEMAETRRRKAVSKALSS